MSAADILRRLRDIGVEVWSEGEKLRYKAPTGVMTPELRAELARHKEDLLGILGNGKVPAPGSLPRPADLPLSFAQTRLWFLHQLAPESALYNSAHAFRLRGALRLEALRASLGEVVRRHEALRTTFVVRGDRPVQVVSPAAPLAVPVVDVGGPHPRPLSRERERGEQQLAEHYARLLAPTLDLECGPLVQALLLRLAPDDHILLFLVPHILSDGWSTGIAVTEVARLYAAFAAGEPSPLPELTVQYPDFTLWERAVLREEELAPRLAWWRERLAGAPEVLALPSDRPRPAAQTFSGARSPLEIPAGVADAFKALARREGTTLFLAGLAAVGRLLAAHAGEEDVIVGTPVTGRVHRDFEGLIGCFVNTLVVRLAVPGEARVRELLARVRSDASEAIAHQEVPFERLVAELRPERDPAAPPLVQVMFTLRVEAPPVRLPGLELEPLATDSGLALVDLVVELAETPGGGFGGFLEYNTDLFDRTTMIRLAGHLERLLAGFAERPDAALADLPLLSAAEGWQILAEWNDTRDDAAGDGLLHRLFEIQAERAPEAPAVLCEGEVLSYRELAWRSGCLARHLQVLGVGPEVTVGVALDRSADMVVSVLAVLRAGGAYVPLDPALPRERLAFMMADSGVRVLITRAGLGWEPPGVLPVELERAAEEIASLPPEPLPVPVDPAGLAYVIYTSGSTGTPKGVMIRHASAVNLVRWVNRTFEVGPADRVLFATSLGFDLSVYDIFGLLAAGGSIRVATSAELRDPESLVRILWTEGIAFWDSAPAALQRLVPFLPETGGEAPRPLRLVFLSGDWIPVRLPDQIRASFPGARVIALGGATEATIWSNFYPVGTVDPAWTSIPYGRPITRARYHVLDRWLRSCPIGVPGDLLIGGDCLAAGYAAAPELTAHKFIPDPFGGAPGGRLYRTGDRARYLPDGNLEFLGRVDTQVKVRGYRIELGEIEVALGAHPEVRDAVALVLGERDDRRLVAAFVPRPGAEPDARVLRGWLRERLPEHMLPALFLRLDTLPVTANGKLDRAALARQAAVAAGTEPARPEGGWTAPATPLEERLAALWAEVLGLPRVGARDNFFELGGDSILSIQVVARAQREGLRVTARDLFRYQTVAELAAAVGEMKDGRDGKDSKDSKDSGGYPLSPLQRGLLFHALYEPGTAEYFERLSCTIRGALDPAAFRAAWERVLARHEGLRSAFIWEGVEEPLQEVRSDVSLPWREEDWRGFARERGATGVAERLDALFREDVARGFDLGAAPLLRGALIRLEETAWHFAFSYHHLLLDGWSLMLVLQEVFAVYQGEPDFSEPRPYRDSIAWLGGRDLAATEAWWRQTLAGFSAPTLIAPGRAPEGAAGIDDVVELRRDLPAALGAALQAAAARSRTTLATLVQGAWAALLSRVKGEEDVVFGLTVSGRSADLPGIDRMVGLFINTLPLRVMVTPETPLPGWLADLQERQATLREHEESPLDQVQRWSGLPAGSALFDHILVIENYPIDASLRRGVRGLEIEDVRTFERTSYPLTVVVVPGEELSLRASLDKRVLSEAEVERLLGWLGNLLAGIAEDPEQRVGDLPLLSESELAELIAAGAPRRETVRPEGTLQGRFEAWASKTPEAPALTYEGRTWTYGELNRQANRLAWRLRSLGVGPEVPVGLEMERSANLVVGILAILKAGGAYVPLDPTSPRERRAWIAEDAFRGITAPVVLDAAALGDPSLAGERDEDPPSVSKADHAAYVIYTSGSTGRPKGVVVTQTNVLRLLDATDSWFGFGPEDVWTLFHSFAFDFSVWEIWGALAYGGRLVVVSYQVSRDPEAFLELLTRERVTVLNQTPSAFRQLVGADEEAGGPDLALRYVVFGGEALDLSILRGWIARRGDERPRLINMYGITETTVHVTFRPVGTRDLELARSPIGEPIPDLGLWLRDRFGDLAPTGVAGEICVGGAGVARGYLHRPDLTAERFVPDPWSGLPGARLYRAGDLARRGRDGELEFLGRIDQQVKIRGFRVEPGEIEAALLAHPEVRAAAVVARPDPQGQPRLVAYVEAPHPLAPSPIPSHPTGRGGTLSPEPQRESVSVPVPPLPVVGRGWERGLGGEGLRDWLAERLPDYMIPAAFVQLDRLPLTAHGKLDRAALPAPEQGPGVGAVLPRTPLERTLAEIWARVLGLAEVGVHDDFFALGGDSILSLQIVARVREAGWRLTPRDLFLNPTVASLAAILERPGEAAETGPVTGEIPLTPIQRWLFARELPQPQWFNQALLFEVRERLDPARLDHALARLLEHHDALRLRVFEGMRIPPPGGSELAPFTRLDLSALPEPLRRPAQDAAAADLQASLDLRRGPVLRLALFDHGADHPGRLLWAIHHLAVDGVSWRILLEDLQRAYAGLPLPAKTTSFKGWAERLQALSASDELPFWESAERRDVPRLPVDFEGENTVAAEEVVGIALEPEETRALLRDVPAAYRTRIDDVLLAALARSLGAWTGASRVVVDLERHGREEGMFQGVDLSRTVGWFTTLFPVVLETGAPGRAGDLLNATKERLRAVPRGGVGYGALRWLTPEGERLRELPRAEVVFNYLGQLDAVLDQGSALHPVDEPAGPAVGPAGRRSHLLEVVGRVSGGRLRLDLHFGRGVHRRETVERLAADLLDALRGLIAHCLEPQAALDRLFAGDRSVEDLYPLTPLQAGILFHSLYAPDSGEYCEGLTCTLRGPLDTSAFRRAWQRVVERHAVLRTAFLWEGLDEPLQVVRRRVDLPWDETAEVDLSRGFDLTAAPLMRLSLTPLGPAEHRFAWAHHHLLLDGWSAALILAEVFALYAAFRSGGEAELPPERPFREYVAFLRGREASADEAFWRRALEGLAAPTPIAGSDSGEEGYGESWATLPEAATAALQALALRLRVTPGVIVQGAWSLLLARVTGEEDVVFGTTVSGRSADLPAIESRIGLFINTVPVRVRLAPEAPAVRWLEAIHVAQVEMREHEHTPLERVQRWSGLPAGTPLFDHLLVFENYPVDASLRQAPAGLEIAEVRIAERTNYPLAVVAIPGRELAFRALWSRRAFDEAEIDRLLGWLRTLLAEIAADPERRTGDLPLLTEAERATLRAAGAPRAVVPSEGALQARFKAWAARTPEAPALTCEGRTWTYGELNRRANRLAWRLRRLGVGPEVRVGLRIERSAELVVGLLAILKAGGAYVPLDPSAPAERLAWITEDALRGVERPVVVTEATVNDPSLDGEPDSDPPTVSGGDHAVYVIYTSGSTGRPKGVVVSHANVLRLLDATEAWFGFGPEEVWTLFHSFAFDFSVWEIWGALAYGGRLVVVPFWVSREPGAFLELLSREQVTVLNQTPSAFRQLVGAMDLATTPATLRWIIFGGEALAPQILASWIARYGDERPRLINMYGITETTVHVTFRPVGKADLDEGRSPIGEAIPDLGLWLRDRPGDLAPTGVAGEICVGGAGVARGYLHRPELTAERFVPDPWSGLPGARLYRAGDLARRWGDGELEFLGRIDQQVKIRGFRIEPGEIEAALLAHPEVREAAVVAMEGRLVAYVAPSAPGRDWLADRLPDSMIPAAFVVLDRLPLTANGKLDRRALPTPEPETSGFVAPRTAAEQIVAAIWAEVLGVEAVGAEDDFFALGGHSLLATQVTSRVRAALGVEVPLRTLFEAPTVAELATAIEEISGAGSTPAVPPLGPQPRGGDIPLSFAQERLWFLDQLEPGSAAYVIPTAVRLTGRLDPAALAAGLQEIVRRHEILRTTFASDRHGRPVQVIAPWLGLSLPQVDLSGLVPALREAEAVRLAAAEARRPFDLAHGPLVRATLLRLETAEHVLLLPMHHIVTDGWSSGILLRELRALLAGSLLLPLPVQYADYSLWQRSWLTGDFLEAELCHWRQCLAGAPHSLDLPTDRPRPALQSFRGALETLVLPAEHSAGISALARSHGATLFMALVAAYAALLSRWSGQEDVLIGNPLAQRSPREVEDLIGFFVNTLVLRADLAGDPPFAELLARVRSASLDLEAHQHLPYTRLIEALAPERDPARPPLFQVAFILQNAPMGPLALPGLTLAPVSVDTGEVKLDLTFSVTETAAGLEVMAEYVRDLFDRTTVQRMLGQWARLLSDAAAHPERRLSDLELLAPAERHQLLREHDDASPAADRTRGLHEIVAAQAARTPDVVAVEGAVEAGEVRWTYRELEARASQLAHRLRTLGVGPEVPVGLCLERTPELVAALLAILKAGGVYVPLDPGYPRERLAFMLADTGAPVLVTRSGLVPTLPEHGARLLLVDDSAAGEESEGFEPGPETAPEDLAYIIFTSGSAGRPKGVLVPHRGLHELIRYHQREFGLGPGDRWLQLSSISFDGSIFQIVLTLGSGATLCLDAGHATFAGPDLLTALRDRRITAVAMPPSVLAALPPGELPGLRIVVVGGEACGPELVDRWARGRRFFNLYGPTEATVSSTLSEHRPGGGKPGIGRAIAGTTVTLLDRRGAPVPVGVPGEIWLGGIGIARGYLHRPDLTAERFLPDPFSGEPGARLYRTGDLARRRPAGDLEFLGRADEQVKIRGVRIEPGEIEALLAGHPDVRDAAVIVREDRPGDPRLVAYVVPPQPRDEGLRRWLAERLPDVMIPSAFVFLEALPLTPNGKLDREALPAPERRVEAAGGAPRTPVEEIVAGIFAEILETGAVGREDDFFALGGHSLLATRVVSRLRAAFGIELPLRRLFEEPTVAGLAAGVESGMVRTAAPPVTPMPRDGEIPLSLAQERLWFLEQLAPGDAAWILPVAMRMTGGLAVPILAAALAEVVQRHEALRTTFPEVGGRPVQRIATRGDLPLPVIDLGALLEGARDAEARRIVAAEAHRPFDLDRGPVLRALLLRASGEEHVLLLALHHIVSDGWSLGVLIREVAALYPAFAAGLTSSLEPLPVQHADFALWQRSWLAGETLDTQLAWWRERLAGASGVLDLPTDRPRPAARQARGASERFALPIDLTAGLADLSRREGATLFMTLAAGLSALLARHTGDEDLLLGTPVAGRTRAEVEGLIGFFINTLVLRADMTGDPPFAGLLARVRDAALGAWAHQDLPFERLVEALQPERDLSRPPLVQVLLVLQNVPLGRLELPGLVLEPLEVDASSVPFDLVVGLIETAEGLRGTVDYDRTLFDRTTIRRLLDRFETLLAAAVATPEARLSLLDALRPAERHQLLVEWNEAPATAALPGLLVHEMFALQAAHTPDAPAVLFAGPDGDQVVTYGELARRADALAAHLRALGVGPETPVAVVCERSPELLVAYLGALAAGCPYIPIDPAVPAERVALMVADAGAAAVLTREKIKDSKDSKDSKDLKDFKDTRDLEDLSSLESLRSLESFRSFAPQLAQIIYTSGSTGRPKGVMVSQGSLASRVRACVELFGFGPADRQMQFVALGFDPVGEEVFPLLASGGGVILHPDPAGLSAAELLDVCDRLGATKINLPGPALPLVLQELIAGRRPRTMRIFATGAASPSAERLTAWSRRRPDQRFFNLYGPTEGTIFATWHAPALRPEVLEPLLRVSIGRPLADSAIYLVDARLQPVPPGAAGELLIGGVGVARGYLGRPDLTAELFVPDSFGPDPGTRLYRTGDLARHLSDGRLEFLGRIDDQVKIRGVRVEPGEVEALLLEHPDVHEAVVLAREDASGDRVLVAWMVPAIKDPRSVLDWLRDRLPAVMVPAALVPLEALPLNANGKVDRAALLRIPLSGAGPREGSVAPRTPAEEILAALWAEVLGLERVGVTDDFFELGGHSLLATQIVSRVREAFGVEIPLRRMFETPTVAGLAEAVERSAAVALPPLQLVPRDGRDLPLSFAQQRLWFLAQLDPESAAYNLPAALRLRGPLDIPVLTATLAGIVRRHEALRTTFASRGGRPVQMIASPSAVPLPVVEMGDEGDLEQLLTADMARPFDLENGPLVRATLVRLGADDHVLLVTLHHIVSDGWSVGVLTRELSALYTAGLAGQPAALPELPVQYADFAVWQRGWLTGETLEAELAWWQEQLAGMPGVLDLPADRPRPPVQSERGAEEAVAFPPELSAALGTFARRSGATLFMVLATSLQALLGRLTGQERFLLGTSIANRDRADLEGLIGFFVNALALRADLTGDPAFTELLGRTRETTLGAYAHQGLPFELLVDALQPERDLSRSPLFQVRLELQNLPAVPLSLPGLEAEQIVPPQRAAQLDLGITLEERGGALAGVAVYSLDLFDAPTIRRRIAEWRTLLEGAVAAPAARLSDLPLLGAAERAQLLTGWNDTAADLPEISFAELFAAQAARTPDALAVAGEGGSLTYCELEERSARLARRLRTQGAGPEAVVALLAERSIDFVTAVVGVLRAGAAYMPLDPEHPPLRHQELLAQSGARIVLTQAILGDLLAGPDEALPALPALPCGPDHLAYILFTSGSTGVPKGVMVTQRGLVNHLILMIEEMGIGPTDRIAQTASQCFDISVWQLVNLLVAGGSVHVYGNEVAHDPERLLERVEADGITILQTVPTLLRLMLASSASLASLRWLIPTGEALPPDLAWRTQQTWPAVRLLNAYGPAECSDDVSFYVLPPFQGDEATVPIGRPLRNFRLYVLDRALHLLPAGAPGELCIAGAGVGRGYVNDPARTAEAFVPDPFAETPGERLYRTGDLARFRPDGLLEYLGRLDFQVKIRGVRIELGEVEAALAAHPAVAAAVALAREDRPGHKTLVAYVVPNPSSQIQNPKSDLRAWLQDRLPDAMVPSAFVVLDALPLTPNGKIDRKALPPPVEEQEEARMGAVAPRTPAEELLAGIWAEVLGIGRVGVHDSFFELGGDSILSIQVVARAREAGLAIAPRDLFLHQTVAELAAVAVAGAPEVEEISGLFEEIPADVLVELAARGVGEAEAAYPLSPAQQGMLFFSLVHGDRAELFVSQFSCTLRGALDTTAFRAACAAVVDRHAVLRTLLLWEGRERAMQVVLPRVEVPWREEDWLGLPADEGRERAAALAHQEWRRGFDLSRAPLLRFVLVRLAGDAWRFIWTNHHILLDGWSEQQLVGEVLEHYRAALAGRAAELPEPRPYRDYIAWLERQDERQAEAFWRQRLAGVDEATPLPPASHRPPRDGQAGRHTDVVLDPRVAERLEALARRHRLTPSTLYLGAWSLLLARWSGRRQVVFGTVVAGRPPELAGYAAMVGLFINALPAVVRVEPGATLADWLTRLQADQAEMRRFEHTPVEQIQRWLGVPWDRPLFESLFVFENFPRTLEAAPKSDLTVEDLTFDEAPGAPLALFVQPAEELILRLMHDERRIDAGTVHRLLSHLTALLTALSEGLDRPLADLPVLAPGEREHLLRAGAPAGRPLPSAPLHELVEATASRHPDAPAVFGQDEILTYADLTARARRLAHRLHGLGIGPDAVVGLCAERTPDLIAGLLGILEAGAAYLPLDPKLPPERQAWMLNDAGAQALVAGGLFTPLPLAGEGPGVRVPLLRLEDFHSGVQATPLNLPVAPGQAAYVLYTSGSTGVPKGVVVSHLSLVRYAEEAVAAYELTPADRCLQFFSPSFDGMAEEVWPALLTGAALVLRPEQPVSTRELLDLCRTREVSVLDLPTAYWHTLMADVAEDAVRWPEAVRLVILGGEEARADALRIWRERINGGVRLVNTYGPTEATIVATRWETAEAERPGFAGGVPIGRPAPNARAYVLDAEGGPVPVGVAGELCLGGAGVARGYLGRPALTAERFAPDPFADEPGARLYRTGDRARWREDGHLDFLGRLDRQVKVRGFRIEPGEIEAVLAAHPGVREAAVVIRAAEGDGERRLVAFVVASAASPEDLRALLAGRLPEHMVPSAIVPLESLPLTPSGKVDRRTLEQMEILAAAEADRAFVAPRSEAEELLAGIFAELLGVPRVSAHDDFFALGGHSLLATRLVTRLRSELGIELPLRDLFEAPTVARLALVVEELVLARVEALSEEEVALLERDV